MKLVTAIIKPFKIDDVRTALEAFDVAGIDQAEHAESGYDFGQLGVGGFHPSTGLPSTRTSTNPTQEVSA